MDMRSRRNNDKSSHKTPVTCSECKLKRQKNETVSCSQCKKTYDFDCFGLSEKLYRLMLPEKRTKVKCKMCTRTSKQIKPITMAVASTSNNSEVSNVTIRKHAPTTMKEPTIATNNMPHVNDSLDTCDEESFDISNSQSERFSKSVDYTSMNTCDIEDFKEQISDLTASLMTTQNELENTIIENNDLKRQIDKLNNEIKLLMSICHATTPNMFNLPLTVTPSRKNKARRSTSCFSPRSIRHITTTNDPSETISGLEAEIGKLQQQLLVAEEEITALSEYIEELKSKLHSETINTMPSSTGPVVNVDEKDNTIVRDEETKPKIFIVGTQQCTGLAAALIETRAEYRCEKYQILSFTKPNAPATEVLKTCKSLHIGDKDKLVICVGENDCDPMITILELYTILKLLGNRNIIIMNVMNCRHINSTLLNRELNLLCNRFSNCSFLKNKYYFRSYIHDTCYCLNIQIDTIDYAEKFLNYDFIKKHIHTRHTNTNFTEHTTRRTKLKNDEINKLNRTTKQTSILDFFRARTPISTILEDSSQKDDFFREKQCDEFHKTNKH